MAAGPTPMIAALAFAPRAERPTFAGRARATVASWSRANVLRLSAALAYYAAFSIAPLLVVALGVAAWFVDAQGLERHVLAQIGGVVGPEVAQWLAGVLAQARAGGGGLATSVAGVLALVGATTALAELKAGLDDIVGSPPARDEAWWSFLRARAFAFGLVLTIAFLLVVSMFAQAALVAFAAWSTAWLGDTLGRAVAGEAIVFAGTGLLFAAIYAWLPARRLGWRGVARATLISAVLFAAGRWVIGTWLATGAAATAFGAAGAFAVFLLWVYYSAVVFYSAAVIAAASGALGPAPADAPAARAGSAR